MPSSERCCRNATVSCLAGPEEEEDPVLHSLCELVTRLLSVPIAGLPAHLDLCVLVAAQLGSRLLAETARMAGSRLSTAFQLLERPAGEPA